ncbi:MAG: rod shape-determining protein MreD [Rhodospirillales bacterium]|nr:rod shape-determining protein MreD [Rhodospirillales bacterium]
MTPGLWQRMDLLARQLTPVMLTLVLVIINVIPLHIPGFSRVAPLLPLMAIYHWAIYRPHLLPAYAVFLIGILQDILTGTPIGVNAFVFLLAYGAVLSQKSFFLGKSFFILWLGFSLIAAVAAVISWMAISLLNVTLVEPKTVVFQYLMTLGFFPAVAWAFLRWQRAFLRQD